MPHFMHPYLEDIVDVKADGHCGFRVVAQHLGKGEESQGLIRLAMVRELTMFRSVYLQVYEYEERLQYILDGLYPPKIMPKSGVASKDKWFTFPDMGHIVATAYNRVVVELTSPTIGHSETFFPLRGHPPSDPTTRILCMGLVPNHFVEVKLKPGCPLPPTNKQWKNHRAGDAEGWEEKFKDRMIEFEQLMENEKAWLPKRKSNEDDPIIVG
jgi:histone-lysine N-methyltransferase SETD2